MSEDARNNRVSTKQFYEALLKQNELIAAIELRQVAACHDMEKRILAELRGVPIQVDTNTKEIDILRKSSNIKDIAVLVVGIVSSAVAAAIGRQ